jgi:hypothetical protein
MKTKSVIGSFIFAALNDIAAQCQNSENQPYADDYMLTDRSCCDG